MFELFEAIVDAFRSLAPGKELRTPDWLIRYLTLIITPFGILYFFILVLTDTQFGKTNGLTKLNNTPAQTLIEIVKRRAKIGVSMNKLRGLHPNVYAIFVLNPYNSKEETFNYEDQTKNDRILINHWSLKQPVDYSYALDSLATQFEWGIPEFKKTHLDYKNCIYEKLDPGAAARTKRALGSWFKSNRIVVCPIEDKKGFQIAHVVIYYEEPLKNKKVITKESVPIIDEFFSIDVSLMVREIREIILAENKNS